MKSTKKRIEEETRLIEKLEANLPADDPDKIHWTKISDAYWRRRNLWAKLEIEENNDD